ncbi:hypothetical protein BK675_16160 [Pseudomonas fluorescens]|nr:hypothetical protein BK677_25720 [Pseudomonas fluorescens]ROO07029.1 hypothetical protein BK675_16160 [Pseudomonas fluorescens]ROO14833.1 hypothetical protein BK676_20400 [Pseudomonas fluorescens]
MRSGSASEDLHRALNGCLALTLRDDISVHALLNVTQQLRRALQQLLKKRVIFIHIAFVFGEIAPLMAQRKQSHLNLAALRGMDRHWNTR